MLLFRVEGGFLEKYIDFGKTLKFIRKSFDYTQETVSHYLNIERQTYSHYETGRNLPSAEILYRLSKFYHIGVENFYLPLYDPRNDVAYNPKEFSKISSAEEAYNLSEYNFSDNEKNRVLLTTSPDIAQIVTLLTDFSKEDLDTIKLTINQMLKDSSK